MTVGAIDAGAKGDGTEIMGRGSVVQGRAVANSATTAAAMTNGATDKLKVGGTVAKVAVVLMG